MIGSCHVLGRSAENMFVFCGRTSPSKAYGLIERMSEDVDLKVVLDAELDLSTSGLRTHLGRLKEATNRDC
jgi:hypothetical protein